MASDTGICVMSYVASYVVGFILCCLVVARLRPDFTRGPPHALVPFERWAMRPGWLCMAMHANNISPRAEFVTYARCALTRIGWAKKKGQVDVSKCVSIYFPEKLSCGGEKGNCPD